MYDASSHTYYNLIPGFKNPEDKTIPPPTDSPQLQHGDIAHEPKVPGGSDTPGKGVTTVNMEAMKVYAKNLAEIVAEGSPLRKVYADLDDVSVRGGGFGTASKLTNKISGAGGLRDATKLTIGDMIRAISEVSDAMLKISANYEQAEDLNKMTNDAYVSYLGQASGDINGMGKSGAPASAG
jgi:hypothetical protein